MNGTPSISEVYAILGPFLRLSSGDRGTLVLLARGPGLFRAQSVADAWDAGFTDILLVEDSRPKYDTSALVRRFPGLRLLLPSRPLTPGARVNLAAREVLSDQFLVVWDDQRLPDEGMTPRVAKRWSESRQLVLAPELRDSKGQDLPAVMVPGLDRDRLKILAFGADEDTVDTLFPQDYSGLYDRRRFLATGGFDPTLTNPFWQKADWGLRSRLWGERLTVERGFRLDYRSAPPVDDETPDESYPRFYLRNLAVRHVGDHGVLPLSRFWSHARRSGRSLPWAWSSFLDEGRWVKTHRYRFRTDARLLTELWGRP